MRYPTLVEILELHEAIITSTGGAPGIRDMEALESAVNQPHLTFDQTDLCHMSWDKMEPEYTKLFSTVYTVEELKGIVDFYNSPAGQSMLKKQPLVMQRVMEIAQSRMHGLVPELQKMAEEFAESVKDAR